MLPIGDFSRVTHLNIRTLRRHHEVGLLEPELVDASSSYRYYSVDQMPTVQVIHRLRELDMPLSYVQRILLSPVPDQRAALVTEHLGRLEAELVPRSVRRRTPGRPAASTTTRSSNAVGDGCCSTDPPPHHPPVGASTPSRCHPPSSS